MEGTRGGKTLINPRMQSRNRDSPWRLHRAEDLPYKKRLPLILSVDLRQRARRDNCKMMLGDNGRRSKITGAPLRIHRDFSRRFNYSIRVHLITLAIEHHNTFESTNTPPALVTVCLVGRALTLKKKKIVGTLFVGYKVHLYETKFISAE